MKEQQERQTHQEQHLVATVKHCVFLILSYL